MLDSHMPVVVSLLRAVNVGGHSVIRMEKLRTLCESLGLEEPKTYVQSGNIVFRARERNVSRLARRLEDAIEETFGMRPDVINRTLAEMRDVVARNPFAGRDDVGNNRLLVTFLASDPGEEARQKVRAITISPEELVISGSEMYIYYPMGAGTSKMPVGAIDRALRVKGTARNWNTVTRLLEMAERLA